MVVLLAVVPLCSLAGTDEPLVDSKVKPRFSLVLRGVQEADQTVLEGLLTVRGILNHGKHRTAVLAGQWVCEGEIMYIRCNGRLRALKVQRIGKNEVVLEVVDEPNQL